MRTRCLAIVVSWASLLSAGVPAAFGFTIRYVPRQYATIQAAIDAAQPGDVVSVDPGTYTDVTHPAGAGDTTRCIAVMKSGITLNGSGPGVTILDAGYRGRGISCSGVTGTTISALTVQKAAAANNGAGIFCTAGSSPIIRNCTLTRNHAPAVICLQGSAPLIYQCELTYNTSPVAGGAVAVDAASPVIRGCDINFNTSGGDGGAVFSIDEPSAVVIDSCVVSYNYPNNATWAGGGLAIEAGSATISNTIMEENFCGTFGGAIYAGSCQLTIGNCHIVDNGLDWAPFGNGAGLYAQACSVLNISNSVFAGNIFNAIGTLDGGGISAYGCANVQIHQCTIANNAGTTGGGLEIEQCSGTVDRSIIAFNGPGSGLYCLNNTTVNIVCDDFYGDQGGEGFTCTDGGGNFSVDPTFCDASNRDYRLKPGSPCLPGTGYTVPCGNLRIGGEGLGCADVGVGEIASVPNSASSLMGVPNPFRTSAVIRFDVARAGQGSLRILDASGRLVRVLEHGQWQSGRHEVVWDGRNQSGERTHGGVYFSELRMDGKREARRIVLLP